MMETYIDLGILLMRLMYASMGREIIFKDKKITVKGQGGKTTEILDGHGMSITDIECAIEASID